MGSSNNFQTCCKCLEILKEGTAYELEGRRWHVECFTCSECGTSLDCDDNLLVLGDGRQLICGNCSFHCHICQKKIQQTAIVTGDQAYCRECFRCRNCNKNIESLRHARTSQGVFCVHCYDLILAKRAAKKKERKKLQQYNHDLSNNKSLPAKPDERDSYDSNNTVTENNNSSNTPPRSDTPEVIESDCIPILIESPVQRQLRGDDENAPNRSPQLRQISPTRSTATTIRPNNVSMAPPSRSVSRNKLSLSPENEEKFKIGLDMPLPILSRDDANSANDMQSLLQIPARSRQRSLSPSEDRQTKAAATSEIDSKPTSPIRPGRRAPQVPPQSSGSDSLTSSSTKGDSLMTTATSNDFGGDEDDDDDKTTLENGIAGFTAPPPPPPPRSPARHKGTGSGSRSRSTSVGMEGIPTGGEAAAAAAKQKLFPSTLGDGGLAITLDHDRPQGEPNHFENRRYFVHEPVASTAATNSKASNDEDQTPNPTTSNIESPNRSRNNTTNSLASPMTPSKNTPNSANARSTFLDKLHAASPKATTAPPPGSTAGTSLVTPPHISQPVFQSSSASLFRSPRNLQEGNSSVKRRNSHASHHERSISDHTLEKLAAFGSQVTRRSTHKSNRSSSNIPDHESPLPGLSSGGSLRGEHHRKKSSSTFSPFLGGNNNGSNIEEEAVASLKESLAAANRKIMLLEAKLAQHDDPQENRTKRYIADLEAKENILQRALKVMDDEVAAKTENALNSRGEEVISALHVELDEMKRSMHEEITRLTLERDELIEANRQLQELRERQSAEESILSVKNSQLSGLNAELTRQIQDLMKEHKSPNTALMSPSQSTQARGINHEDFSDLDVSHHNHNLSNSSGNNNIFGGGPSEGAAPGATVSPEKQFRTGITTDMISSPIPIADLSKNGSGGGFEGPAVTVLDGPDSSRLGGAGRTTVPAPSTSSNNRRGFWRMVPGVRNLNRFLGSEQQQHEQLLAMSYSHGSLSGSMSQEDLSLESVNEASHDDSNHSNGLGRANSVRTRMNRSKNNLMRRGGGGNNGGIIDNIERPPLFGGELSVRAMHEGYPIPFIVTRCIEEVERRGIKFEGIYRKSGAKSQIQALQEAFEVSNYPLINKLMEGDINAVTSVSKQYLRHLTIPLIVFELYDEFINASLSISDGISTHERSIQLHRQLITRLPDTHRLCLEAIIKHLSRLSNYSSINLMTTKNLAVVFAPTLARDSIGERELQDMRLRNDGIEFMINNVDAIF